MGRIRWIIVALCVAVIAAGCGRGSDSSADDDDPTTSTSTGASGNAAEFGSLTNVCQPGDAAGAPAPGVTDGEIRIATFSDAGYAGRPGLNQELFDTAAVFSQWCNDAGGINGRKIVVDERDAALTNYKPKILESCQQDFFMVGGGAVFDNTGVEDRLKCLLPDIAGYVVTPEARGADLLVQPLPNPINALQIGDFRWLGKKYPGSTDHVGILTGSLPTTAIVARQDKEGVESLGWKVVYDDQYPPTGPTSWAPYVQAMKDKGVEGLIWIGEPENLAKLEQAMVDASFSVSWVRADPNHNDKKLIELAGPAVKDTYVWSSVVPFDDAENSPAMQQYLDAFAKYSPDAKTKAYLGLQAWSSWLLFAQAARDCGSDLTRKCVYENAKKIHAWTGGGLHAQTDPGATKGSGCFVLLHATPNGFVKADIDPNEGIYNCDPKNGYVLKGDYGKGITFADVGGSISDLK
jgi:hypothetical protein